MRYFFSATVFLMAFCTHSFAGWMIRQNCQAKVEEIYRAEYSSAQNKAEHANARLAEINKLNDELNKVSAEFKSDVQKLGLDHLVFDKNNNNTLSCLVFVPNGLVSMVIGTKGKQIVHLAQTTKTHIAVNQPVFKMCHRTILINGYPKEISIAIYKIQTIMEERYLEIPDCEKESMPMNLNEIKTTVSFFNKTRLIFF